MITIVNAERHVAPATLRDLVQEVVVSNTASLQREVQSLKARIESLLVGKSGGGKSKAKMNKKNPPATKPPPDGSIKRRLKQAPAKNCRGAGSGKAGARPAAKQRARDRSRGSTAASSNKRANPSRTKSSGRKPASSKKKRS